MDDTTKNPLPAPTEAQHSNAPAAVGFEASWERFRAEAGRVDARDVKTFPYNTAIVLHNVTAGVAAVLAEQRWFEERPDAPRVDFLRVASTVGAAEGLVYVGGQAASIGRVAPGLRPKLVRARVVLRTLKSAAGTLVATGELRAEEIPVGAGRGPLATAHDCLAYATLFRAKHAKTRGATSVKAALVTEAAALGSELLGALKPRGSMKRAARSEPERAAADARDRMAVVVAGHYAYVEQVAGWRWGRGLDAFVPAMLSRDTARGAATEDEALDEEDDLGEDADEDADDARDEADEKVDEEAEDDGDAADEEADAPAAVTPTKPGPKKTVPAKPTKPAKRAVR